MTKGVMKSHAYRLYGSRGSCNILYVRPVHHFPNPTLGVFQVQMQETDALMQEQEYISGPLDSWLSSFLVWAANSTEYRYRETVYEN